MATANVCFWNAYGGRFSDISTICILNMRSSIGEDIPISSTLSGFGDSCDSPSRSKGTAPMCSMPTGPYVVHFCTTAPAAAPGGRRKRAGPAVTGRCLRGPGYGRSRGAHSSIRASIASASRDRSCGAGIGGRPSRSQRFCAISRLPSGFRWSQSRISFA